MVKKKYKLVLIKWEDSILGFQGWKTIKEQPDHRGIMISVGFIIRENKHTITLYPHIQKSNLNGTGDIIIPKSAIKKINKLKTK